MENNRFRGERLKNARLLHLSSCKKYSVGKSSTRAIITTRCISGMLPFSYWERGISIGKHPVR